LPIWRYCAGASRAAGRNLMTRVFRIFVLTLAGLTAFVLPIELFECWETGSQTARGKRAGPVEEPGTMSTTIYG
jgi:hypothetical protein